ncbi:MAG: hypothetical protein WCG10_01080 [Chlamydiota bacterium]
MSNRTQPQTYAPGTFQPALSFNPFNTTAKPTTSSAVATSPSFHNPATSAPNLQGLFQQRVIISSTTMPNFTGPTSSRMYSQHAPNGQTSLVHAFQPLSTIPSGAPSFRPPFFQERTMPNIIATQLPQAPAQYTLASRSNPYQQSSVADLLFPPKPIINPYYSRESLINMFIYDPIVDVTALVDTVMPLIAPQTFLVQAFLIAGFFKDLTLEERDRVANYAYSFITADMDPEKRITIINALVAARTAEHVDIAVARAHSLINSTTSTADRIAIITTQLSQAAIAHQQTFTVGRSNAQETFTVDRLDFQANSTQLLLDYSKRILAHPLRTLPSIRYRGSLAVDAGGVLRDFISNLFLSIFKEPIQLPMKIEETGCIPKIDSSHNMELTIQIQCFKAFGTLFGAILYRNLTFPSTKQITLGCYFHLVVFKMLHTLSPQDLQKIPENLVDKTNLHPDVQKKLLKPLLLDLYPHLCPHTDLLNDALNDYSTPLNIPGLEEISNMDQLLEGYPEITDIVFAMAIIAKALHQQFSYSSQQALWPTSAQLLSDQIQGVAINKNIVRTALKCPREDVEYLSRFNTWIDQASDGQLMKLVFAITGSKTLLPNTKLYINFIFNPDAPLAFHTCTNTLEIPRRLITNPQFNQLLNLSIEDVDFNDL